MSLSHQQKVYIPKEARTNQYITAEIKVTDELLSQYPDYQSCYQTLSRLIFNLAEQHDLRNVHVITNDKLPVVRYHTEAYCFQTTEQILFFIIQPTTKPKIYSRKKTIAPVNCALSSLPRVKISAVIPPVSTLECANY